ncbi:MAG: hypothetical protein EOO29_03245 [Comamonadaceae bacterium]|nr:MAG: hypothetical protein EOO29_03245 [Comamonadaceae bacterium]
MVEILLALMVLPLFLTRLLRGVRLIARAICELIDSPDFLRVMHWIKRGAILIAYQLMTYPQTKMKSPIEISNAFVSAVFFFSAGGIIALDAFLLMCFVIAKTLSDGWTVHLIFGLLLLLPMIAGGAWTFRMARHANQDTRVLWRLNGHKPVARQMALYVPTAAFFGIASAVAWLQTAARLT